MSIFFEMVEKCIFTSLFTSPNNVNYNYNIGIIIIVYELVFKYIKLS